jgi:chemotaxis protein MotA
MDIATFIGFIAGIVLVVGSILMGSEIGAFINIPGLAVVVGGTACATLVSERLANVLSTAKITMKAVFDKQASIDEMIARIAELAATVRKEGLLSLENQEIDNDFLAKGVRMAVDGLPPEELQAVLRAELVAMKQRHKRGVNLFKFMASTAPAMGMVGTLIGLVQMLQSLDDPKTIGPAMAVALLTTFYGAVLAFMVFGPLSEKLKYRSDEESACMIIIIEGIISIAKGENARAITEKLEGYLPPKERKSAA